MIVLPKRNIVQRALNRALYRFGIRPFPIRFESSLPEAGADAATVFNAVYATDYWGTLETKSGGGSTIEATAQYVQQLIAAINELGVKSMFDAPCGDLNWMHRVITQTGVAYRGGDIASEAVELALRRHPNVSLFDICADRFPSADLWHCRDTFFHLGFADIRRALAKARESDIEYAAITTHRARWLKNVDIKTGGFRLLDLERPPFNFPRAIRYLRDYPPQQFPRFVGIWRMSDLS